jgi:hypothetical protein
MRHTRPVETSHLNPILLSPPEVPARLIAEVGKKRAHANMVLGLEEIEFGFAVLLRHHVIGLDLDDSIRIAVLGNPVPHRQIVAHVKECQQASRDGKNAFHARTPRGVGPRRADLAGTVYRSINIMLNPRGRQYFQ